MYCTCSVVHKFGVVRTCTCGVHAYMKCSAQCSVHLLLHGVVYLVFI